MSSGIPQGWIDAALGPPRAFGAPLGRARLRVEAEDFVVQEDLGFAPSGVGSHALLRVRKRGANTEWVARELARAVGCRPFDVGYAGLKDRCAVTTQWFSVPMPRAPRRNASVVAAGEPVALADASTAAVSAAAPSAASARPSGPRPDPKATEHALLTAPDAATSALSDLAAIRGPGYEVLEAQAHAKKLPRGALAGNRFQIRLRDFNAPADALAARIEAISRHGVPNYFGPQRFGRDASNLRKITRDLRAIQHREQTYVLSAARSLIFNAVLAARVADGTWSTLEQGDVANLDARGSVFRVDAIDEQLQQRSAALDIHPTGPLWGRDDLMSQSRIRTLEEQVAGQYDEPCALVIAAGMRQERRALRLAVRELSYAREGDDVVLRFWLTKGSFATTVLREVIEDDAGSDYE
jgi:tRNA pseudouridine13 synthase